MASLHVVQINFVMAPAHLTPLELLDRWPSLADVAETVASAGMHVSVLQASAYTAHVVREGIDYYFSPPEGFAALLGQLGPELIHVHGLDAARQAYGLVSRLPQMPLVLQDHANRPPQRWRQLSWRRWYGAASGIAFTSKELMQPFTRTCLFGPSTRLFAIPESSSRFTPGDSGHARAQMNVHGAPCVVSIGHLSTGKGFLTVLDGIARAVARLPGLQLWCAFGTAPLLHEVQRRITEDPRLAGRVHLLGSISHAHVETLLRAADIFVSGSLAESCGYAALEAMACGVSPVLTDIPSFRALIGAGRIGALWPGGNATQLAEALVSQASHRRSRREVRAHFDQTLSFAAVGRQWAQAYEQVMADSPRSHR